MVGSEGRLLLILRWGRKVPRAILRALDSNDQHSRYPIIPSEVARSGRGVVKVKASVENVENRVSFSAALVVTSRFPDHHRSCLAEQLGLDLKTLTDNNLLASFLGEARCNQNGEGHEQEREDDAISHAGISLPKYPRNRGPETGAARSDCPTSLSRTLVMRNLPVIIKNPPLTDLPSKRELDSLSPLALGLSAVIDCRNHHLILARHLADEPADIEMPMRFHRLAVVRGVVNQEHPKSFVVDTGGEVISISLGTATDLNMRPVRHIPLRVYGTSGWDARAFLLPGVDLAFDEISYENFSVVVLNLHRPSALLGFHIGGIVGHTFLRNYRVALDIDRAVLRLTKS